MQPAVRSGVAACIAGTLGTTGQQGGGGCEGGLPVVAMSEHRRTRLYRSTAWASIDRRSGQSLGTSRPSPKPSAQKRGREEPMLRSATRRAASGSSWPSSASGNVPKWIATAVAAPRSCWACTAWAGTIVDRAHEPLWHVGADGRTGEPDGSGALSGSRRSAGRSPCPRRRRRLRPDLAGTKARPERVIAVAEAAVREVLGRDARSGEPGRQLLALPPVELVGPECRRSSGWPRYPAREEARGGTCPRPAASTSAGPGGRSDRG